MHSWLLTAHVYDAPFRLKIHGLLTVPRNIALSVGLRLHITEPRSGDLFNGKSQININK
jgi:hypothetical protein